MAPVEPLPPSCPVVFLTILYAFFTLPEMGSISSISRPNAPFLAEDPWLLSSGLRGDLVGDLGVAAKSLAISDYVIIMERTQANKMTYEIEYIHYMNRT